MKVLKVSLPAHTEAPSWGQLALFAVVVFVCALLAERLTVFLHEVLGHAATAAALGATIKRVVLRPFGGGRVLYRYPEGTEAWAAVVSASAGLAVDLLVALAALVMLRVLGRRRPLLGLFVSFVLIRALIGSLGYLTLGLFYKTGDPGFVGQRLGLGPAPWTDWGPWLIFLICLAPAMYVAARGYLRQQEFWLPARSWKTRGARALIAAAALGLLAVLAVVTHSKPSVDFEGAGARQARVLAIQKEVEAQERAFVQANPEATEEEIKAHLEAFVARLERKPRAVKVAKPFALRPVVVLMLALGAVVALWMSGRLEPSPQASSARLTAAHAMLLAAVAAAVVLTLTFKPHW